MKVQLCLKASWWQCQANGAKPPATSIQAYHAIFYMQAQLSHTGITVKHVAHHGTPVPNEQPGHEEAVALVCPAAPPACCCGATCAGGGSCLCLLPCQANLEGPAGHSVLHLCLQHRVGFGLALRRPPRVGAFHGAHQRTVFARQTLPGKAFQI